jgi:DNA-binding NarL/FixJ family response regulator
MTVDKPVIDGPARRLAELGASIASREYARRGVRMSNETIRVVIADDHSLFREGLRVLLQTVSDISVVADVADGVEAIGATVRLTPDILLLDLDMPRRGGEETLHELRRSQPDVKVLILTMYAEHEHLLPLLEAGARGYLTKDAAASDLIDAIRVVASGEIYVRPAAARLLAAAVVPHDAAPTARSRFDGLSAREQRVLQGVAQGYSGAEIARQLKISSKTVDAFKRRIEDKLGLSHRTDYVRFGIEADILRSCPDSSPPFRTPSRAQAN